MQMMLTMLVLAYPAPREEPISDKAIGFIGVTFQAAEAGVSVSELTRNGPAQRAGVKSGDVIVKFGGQPIMFDSFVKFIVATRPGTVVPLELQRAGEVVHVKITIGVRPPDFPYPLPELESSMPNEAPVPQRPLIPAPNGK